jgi:hypothetical protein
MNPTGEYRTAILPFKKLEPRACTALAAALRDVIGLLESWGIPVSSPVRLRAAEKHPRKVAEANSYGETEEELIRTAKAIDLAIDFYLISTSLNKDRDDPIANDLVRALGGTLDGNIKNLSSYDMQAQFWAGTLLAQSGLRPAFIAQGNKPTPDYLVSVWSLDFAVEVKRPHSVNSAKKRLKEAADQLYDYGKPGIIILDLSACVFTDDLIIPKGTVSARQAVTKRLSDLEAELVSYIESYPRPEKFSKVVDLVTFGRFWVWKNLDPPTEDAGPVFRMNPFPDVYKINLYDYINQLQEMVLKGVGKLTGNPVAVRRVYKG